MRGVKVTIVYKNGTTVTLRCHSFSVSRSKITGEITGMEWDDAKPRPLLVGLEEVAAVWSRTTWRPSIHRRRQEQP